MSGHNYLPPELIEAILPFLPAKSLGRFKSVSKPWCSLISSPQFIKTHIPNTTKKNPNPNPTQLILFTGNNYSLYSVDIKQLNALIKSATGIKLRFKKPRVLWERILGSCNGLVLAEDYCGISFLINPTTRDLLKLPDGPPFPDDTSYDSYAYGIGYDSSTDDYKVVEIPVFHTQDVPSPGCLFVNVYSLRNNSWRKLPHSSFYKYDGCHGVLVNENLHWLVTSTRAGHPKTILVAFSLSNEEFREIELPDDFISSEFGYFFKLVALGGKLGIYGDEFWMMEEYGVGKSWTEVCIIGRKIDSGLMPFCYVEGSNRDIVLGDEDRVVVYNMDERVSRNVRIARFREGFDVGGTYVETLESLARFH